MSKNSKITIWHIGIDKNAKGGIATVIRLLIEEQAQRQDVRVKNLATTNSGSKISKAMVLAVALGKLFWACLFKQVDVLHIHTSSGISLKRKALFISLGQFFGISIVLHVHAGNFKMWYEESSPEKQAWIRCQLDKAQVVLALTGFWKEFLTPLTSSPVHAVYNSVPLDAFHWPRPPRKPGPLRMLFLGLLGKAKGTYDLLEGIHKVVLSPHPINVELSIGGNGEVIETKEMISKLNLDDSVKFLGWVGLEEKIELFSQTDVFVLPSYYEGLPMAILEAMAAGVAILTTPINGIPEAVHDGENGVFIEPGNVAELVNAICDFAQDIGKAKQYGEAGRAEISSRFNIKTAADQLDNIYSDCIND